MMEEIPNTAGKKTKYGKKTYGNAIFKFICYSITVIALLLLYFPIYWMFTSLTKDSVEAEQIPPKLYFTVPNDYQIVLNTEGAAGYQDKTEEEQNEQFIFEALDILWLTMGRGMHLNCNSLEVVRVENGTVLARARLNYNTFTEWKNKSQELEDGTYENLLFADSVTEKIISNWRTGATETARTKYNRLKQLLISDGYADGLNTPYVARAGSGEFSDTLSLYFSKVSDPENPDYEFTSPSERITLVTGKIGEITYSGHFFGMFNAFFRAVTKYANTQFGYIGYFLNSIKLSLAQVLVTIFFTGGCAYAMSCLMKKKLSKICFYVLLVTMMIPGVVNIIPLYNFYMRLGLKNTIWPFVFASIGSPWWIIIFRGIFGTMAKELREAAKIDGAGELRIYFQIMMPLAQSMFVVLGLRTFIATWNSYFWENLLFTAPQKFNLTLIVRQSMSATDATGKQDVAVNMAMALLAAIPTLFIFAFFQKYLVKGLTFEGLKG